MAKKDPTDLSVEEKLKTLFQLQTALSAIDEKKALRGELPLEVEDLEAEIEGLNTRVERIQAEVNDFERAISQKKAEIIEAQNSVDRYKQQLNEVRNNREYDTLSKEIEFQSLEIELCNKKINEAQRRIAEKQEETRSWRRLVLRRISSRRRLRSWRLRLSPVCSPRSSVFARTLAMVWASYTCSVMPVVVASIRFHLSVSWTLRCTRRSSFASTAVVSSSILSWLV